MSQYRRSPMAGWSDINDLPRGQNGRALCRRCSVEVPKGRKTFCSTACVHEWKLRTDPNYVRKQVFERDHGVCSGCGSDTMVMVEVRWKRARGSGHLWQADHIVPVIEYGGECGLENYRTLCTTCHKRATSDLRQRMKARRIADKHMPLLEAQ